MNPVFEKFLRFFGLVIAFLLGGTVVYIGYLQFWSELGSALIILLLVLGGVVSSIVCSAFHELGHLVFGWLCGFRFNSIRIGFFTIFRREGKIRFSFQELPSSLAGATEMLPKTSEKLYSRFLAVICGGLVFSFLFLVGAAVSLILYKSLPFAAYMFLCTSLPFAFHIFYYNVLPFNDDNMDTDGGMLRGLIKQETSYLTSVNVLAIEGYLYQGYTPSQISRELYFGLPQLPEDDLNFIILTDYRFNYYLDCGDIANACKAGDRLESLLEYVPKFYKNEILTDILYCKSCLQRDKQAAERYYEQTSIYLKGENSLRTRRILAAYALYVQEDKMAALREVNEAERKAEDYEIRGVEKYERKLIAGIRAGIIEQHMTE